MRVGRAAAGLVVTLTLLLSGCGFGADEPDFASPPTATPTTPLPADQVVFTVRTSGGFVPPLVVALESPELLLYGDGRVVEAGDPAKSASSVPRAYEVAQVDPLLIARFAAEAEATGLFAPGVDFGIPGVTDMPSTKVAVRGEGSNIHSVTVYAFEAGFEEGLTKSQKAARQSLSNLVARARSLRPADRSAPYQPDRVKVSELALSDSTTSGPAWPGPDPDDFMTKAPAGYPVQACGRVRGADAAELYRVALANPGAVWEVSGSARVLAVVPELTADEQCWL